MMILDIARIAADAEWTEQIPMTPVRSHNGSVWSEMAPDALASSLALAAACLREAAQDSHATQRAA